MSFSNRYSAADVAELADAQASGACGLTLVKVQLLSSALFSGEIIPAIDVCLDFAGNQI